MGLTWSHKCLVWCLVFPRMTPQQADSCFMGSKNSGPFKWQFYLYFMHELMMYLEYRSIVPVSQVSWILQSLFWEKLRQHKHLPAQGHCNQFLQHWCYFFPTFSKWVCVCVELYRVYPLGKGVEKRLAEVIMDISTLYSRNFYYTFR